MLALTDLLVYWCSGSCPRIALHKVLVVKGKINNNSSSFNSADEVDPALIKKNAIPDVKKSWKSNNNRKEVPLEGYF